MCQDGQLSLAAARSVGRSAVERVLATAGPSCGAGGRYDSQEGAQAFLSEVRKQKMVQMVQHLAGPHTVSSAVSAVHYHRPSSGVLGSTAVC